MSLEEKQPRAVMAWGMAALGCTALAVLSANIAGLVPVPVLNNLHAPRTDATSLNQLRVVAMDMRADMAVISSQYRALINRFNLMDDDSTATLRRLAAVESSMPLLIESLPNGADIDRSLFTAAIPGDGGEHVEVDGGTMTVRQVPLFSGPASVAVQDQPLPAEIVPLLTEVAAATGIIVGAPMSASAVTDYYQAVTDVAGMLLLGTLPLVNGGETGTGRLVLGPLPDMASAEIVCTQLVRLDIACEPAPYSGIPLEQTGQ